MILEKVMPYNISSIHIPASQNRISDYFSRHPSSKKCLAEEFKLDRPQFRVNIEGQVKIGENYINRIVRTNPTCDLSDPWLIQISREGENCPQFRVLKELVLLKPSLQENFQLKKDHPLKAIENIIPEMSLETIPEINKQIVVRDGVEIFIPTQFRRELLDKLHSTHLSTEPMKHLARGKFWWPKIHKEIEETYTQYKPCKSESIAKIQKKCKVCPLFSDSLSPGQILHLDYLE